MAMQPSVFISCVSPEFRSTRQRIANILIRLGYTPVFQETFGVESGDLCEVLRNKIDACGGLIQIIGKAYGAEPPTSDPEFGRVSYTQFEFLYARKRGTKTWLIFAGDGCSTDTPADRLDLPHDSGVDAVAYQSERRSLQKKYIADRTCDGHLHHPAASDAALELSVERLQDNLAELRRKFSVWQNKVLVSLAGMAILLLGVAGTVWWAQHRQQIQLGNIIRSVNNITVESRRITKEKIADQLRIAADQAYRKALADADLRKDWHERHRLRDAAKTEQDARLVRVEELASSFSELEGTPGSTDVMDEMTRILRDQGVDEALAYTVTQRQHILETVKARANATHEKNRAELRPLLQAANLQINKANFTSADATLREIVLIEPDWPDALCAIYQCQLHQGDHFMLYETVPAALASYECAREACTHLLRLEPDKSDWQGYVSVSLSRTGDVKIRQGDFSGGLEAYQHSADIFKKLADDDSTNTEAEHGLGYTVAKIGDIKVAQGDLPGALAAFQQGLIIANKLAASDPTNASWQLDLSTEVDQVGDVKFTQGDLGGALAAHKQSMEIRKKLRDSDPANAQWQRYLSISLNEIGGVLQAQGDLTGALATFQQGLEIAKKLLAADPANTQGQRDVSVSLEKIGNLSAAQSNLPGALVAYEQSLDIRKKLATDDPTDAQAQRDLSVSLNKIGDTKADQGDLAGALAAYEPSLEIRKKLAADDLSNARGQRDVSVSLERIGDVKAAQGNFSGALVAYHMSLEIREKLATADHTNAISQRDLVVSYLKLTDASEKFSKFDDAKQYWVLARDTLLALKRRGIRVSPDDEADLTKLQQKAGY